MHHLMPLILFLLPILYSTDTVFSHPNPPGLIITKTDLSNSTGLYRQEVQFFNLNGTGYIGVDLLEIALEAKETDAHVKIAITSSNRIKFALLECLRKRKPIFGKDIEKGDDLYFGGRFVDILIKKGEKKCLNESYDLRIRITSETATNGSIVITTSNRFQNQPTSKAIRAQVLIGTSTQYRVNLGGVVAHWRNGSIAKSSIVMFLKNFTADSIVFGKCGLEHKTLNVTGLDHIVINETIVKFFELLSPVLCDHNRQRGSLEITIHSNTSTFGFLRFEVVDQDASKAWSFEGHMRITIAFTVLLTAIFCIPLCYCCVIRKPKSLSQKAKKARDGAQFTRHRNLSGGEEHEMQTFHKDNDGEEMEEEPNTSEPSETIQEPSTSQAIQEEPEFDDEIRLKNMEEEDFMGEKFEEETVRLLDHDYNEIHAPEEEPEMARTEEDIVDVGFSPEAWAILTSKEKKRYSKRQSQQSDKRSSSLQQTSEFL